MKKSKTITNTKEVMFYERKGIKAAIASASCLLMFTGFTTPAQANDFGIAYKTNGPTAAESFNTMTLDEYMESRDGTQKLETAVYPDINEALPISEINVELSEEYIAEQARLKAEEEARVAAEASAAERAAEQTVQNRSNSNHATVTPAYSSVPQGEGVSGFINAARAQIGASQDCTDLVQNSLAAVGLFERRDQGGYDLGPMDFGRFGTQISPSEARAGDIIMRYGHVAIYTGDGVNHSAVHGGWGGYQTVESPYDANPGSYTVIRVAGL